MHKFLLNRNLQNLLELNFGDEVGRSNADADDEFIILLKFIIIQFFFHNVGFVIQLEISCKEIKLIKMFDYENLPEIVDEIYKLLDRLWVFYFFNKEFSFY